MAGKPLREYYEAVGHARASDAMFGLVDRSMPVTEAAIRELHRLFYHQIDMGQAGQYREQRVFITGSRFTSPSADKVAGVMGEFVRWMAENEAPCIRWCLRHRHTSGSCSSTPLWTVMAG